MMMSCQHVMSTCTLCPLVPCRSRTALSLTWCLIILWTSGWPAHQQRSVSLSKFCTMPARPTGREKPGLWTRLGSWSSRAHRENLVMVLTMILELVPLTPQHTLHPEPCRPDGRATFLPDRQSSSTVSPNSQEVIITSRIMFSRYVND